MRTRHRFLGWLLPLLATMFVLPAIAHEISMAELQVRELGGGDFMFNWGAGEKRSPADTLRPDWPDGCRTEGNILHCGEDGLVGTLSIKGVGEAFSAALVKVYWRDGRTNVYTVTSGQPHVRLYGAATDERGFLEIASSYTVLGIEHILSGIDHLMFVIGLLFLVGFERRLFWTITAFTAAHSVTLALSALGLLTLRPPPVEATIALSIMLVAGEALRNRPTLSRRWPALVAFLFGLVHGLGFAGALQEIGLPQRHLGSALLSFNIGVEIGQLGVLAAAWGLYRLAARLPHQAQLRRLALYVIGSTAAWWSIGRIVAIVA